MLGMLAWGIIAWLVAEEWIGWLTCLWLCCLRCGASFLLDRARVLVGIGTKQREASSPTRSRSPRTLSRPSDTTSPTVARWWTTSTTTMVRCQCCYCSFRSLMIDRAIERSRKGFIHVLTHALSLCTCSINHYCRGSYPFTHDDGVYCGFQVGSSRRTGRASSAS